MLVVQFKAVLIINNELLDLVSTIEHCCQGNHDNRWEEVRQLSLTVDKDVTDTVYLS